MNITVYVWKITSTEKILLDNIIEKSLDKKEYLFIELQDDPGNKPAPGDTLLCFGTRAFNLISSGHPQAIKLPQLDKLVDKQENRSYRLEVWDTLQRIKNTPAQLVEDQKLEIKPEDLALNLTTKNKDLLKHIQEDGTEYWIGKTVTGKTVLISNTTGPLFSVNNNLLNCNFRLTFEELYAARLAVEILGLTSLTLAKGNKDD